MKEAARLFLDMAAVTSFSVRNHKGRSRDFLLSCVDLVDGWNISCFDLMYDTVHLLFSLLSARFREAIPCTQKTKRARAHRFPRGLYSVQEKMKRYRDIV